MKSDRHQNGRAIQAEWRWEKPGQGNTDAKQSQRDNRKQLLFDYEKDKNRCEGQKSRHFPKALQNSDLDARERGPLYDEIVE